MRIKLSEELIDLYERKGEINELMDMLEGDTWGNNKWYYMMCRLLQRTDSGWDEAKENYISTVWPDTVTWDAEELRELIAEIEVFWLTQVEYMHNKLDDELTRQIKEEEE